MRIEYFWQLGCGPCQTFGPMVEDLCRGYGIPLHYKRVDQFKETAQALQIRGVPTLVAFVGEIEVGRQVGVCTKSELKRLLVQWGLS